ncbi:MAG: Fic/DOC family N-terminal domain-containing protein [Pseudomonadota bacterium]
MEIPLQNLPFPNEEELESRAVLKKAALANRYLAELKGIAATIPNEAILINTLTLQEAKDSSEVENIITTHDDLFKAGIFADYIQSPAAKEVQDYATAIRQGFVQVRETRLIRLTDIIAIQRVLEKNRAGLRKLPGTELKNQQTGEVIYTPPQDATQIEALMNNLVDYINDDTLSDVEPLVKMALIHHQFESIHPFYDGNGRCGRILNILYLNARGLLDLPVLYLSRYFIRDKGEYYRQLQAVREGNGWESWLLYMLEGVVQTSQQTISLIKQINTLMQRYKHGIRNDLSKVYSQDLINNLFRHPYTKIEFVMNDLCVSRITATKYLQQLVEGGYLRKAKIGRSNYYINEALFGLLSENPEAEQAN